MPLEVPELAPVIVTKSGLFDTAVQAQPLPPARVTVNVPVPPEAAMLTLPGVTLTPQAALWLTVKVSEPIVIAVEREVVTGLLVAVKEMLPGPVPEAGEVMVNQSAPPVMVQEQPMLVVAKLNVPEPPEAAMVVELEPIQVNGWPRCFV